MPGAQTASQAAQIVCHGPGRLGLRRAAVARASARLTAWADTWRPYLPTLPSDPHRIAAVAGAADDRPRLQAAFDARVHRHAESFHPEDSELMAAADAARAAPTVPGASSTTPAESAGIGSRAPRRPASLSA
jgi:hypothetical protein